MRGALPLILAGWFLVVHFGTTHDPRDDTPTALGIQIGWGDPAYETKADCEAEGNKLVREFYADARKRHEKVAWPTTFQCKQHKGKPGSVAVPIHPTPGADGSSGR
jgi:hypothetical protein